MMAEAEDQHLLWLKHMAITTLLPHAVREERDGQPEMFNTILHVARAFREPEFMWDEIIEFVSTLFSEASPRAAILASPHLPWRRLKDRQDLVQQWIEMVSVTPHTEELAQGAVDTLLQVASRPDLLQNITPEAWSWLTLRPSLPPVCIGQALGTNHRVVEAVRALKDLEVLKSYFLLVWSEWGWIKDGGLNEMCISILEDFGGIGMGRHRADLIQRLDHVLGQLDHGLGYLAKHNPYIREENHVQGMKDQYQQLRGKLLGANTEAISRTPHLMIPILCVLTLILDAHRISHDVYVCTPSPMSIVLGLKRSVPPLPTLFVLLLQYHPSVLLRSLAVLSSSRPPKRTSGRVNLCDLIASVIPLWPSVYTFVEYQRPIFPCSLVAPLGCQYVAVDRLFTYTIT